MVKPEPTPPTDRSVQATLLNQDNQPLSIVGAKLLFREGRCILRPPIGANLPTLLETSKTLRIHATEIWALTDGHISGEFLNFAMTRIPPVIQFVQR